MPFDLVLISDSGTDHGIPFVDTGNEFYDPGQADPGVSDPGHYDPGQQDPGNNDPGHYDPGQTDPGPHDPGLRDPGPFDPGQPDTNGGLLDCKGLYQCLSGCPKDSNGYITQSCRDECNAKTSAQGHQVNDALLKCLSDNSCNTLTGDAFSKCLEDHCQDEYFRCFSGDLYQTCRDLNSCLVSCPKDDPSTPDKDENARCRGDCYENASYTANWDWEYLRRCIVAACPGDANGNIDPACLNQQITDPSKCYNQADKCWPHGTTKCKDFWTCLNNCSNGDSACIKQCYDDATYTAQYLYGDMLDCALTNCKSECNSNDDTACNNCLNTQINSGGACYSKNQACQNDTATRGGF